MRKRRLRMFATLLKLHRMRSQDIILEYYDASIYKEDFDNLREDRWLNDNNLTFWYEYLERTECLKISDEVSLARPSMAFLLAQSKVRYIFLPINNNSNVEHAEGGSHWSLLVVDRNHTQGHSGSASTYYYDTLGVVNLAEAENVAHKMARLLGLDKLRMKVMTVQQQTNGSDCGVFVCMITSLLLQRIVHAVTAAAVTAGAAGADNGSGSGSGDIDFEVQHHQFHPNQGRHQASYTILELISKHGRGTEFNACDTNTSSMGSNT
ncbi:hypothetical protein V1514DRAFT_188285 [Lipomyces japonicus]|uniref:uncharacterized protein n=1 Tax=Lipomyces japonicus TaxID=56871 RepID=UPI0034CF866D